MENASIYELYLLHKDVEYLKIIGTTIFQAIF